MGGAVPRIAVVGAGIRGSMFARAARQHPQAVLVAVCEPSASRARSLSTELGVAVYPELSSLLAAHPEVTAAVIATPDFAHRDAAVQCARLGIDLLIEKPLATTSDDAFAIVEASSRSGSRVVVGFENRWNPWFAQVHGQLRTGQHGPVRNQIANLNDTIFVPTKMLSWAAHSSPAWFLMPHVLDLAMWLGETVPVEVFARGTRKSLPARGVDTWDGVTASFLMSDDSYVLLNTQWALPEGYPAVFDFRYELHAEESSFHFDVSDSGVQQFDADKGRRLQFGVYESHGRLHGIPIDMINDFIAVLNGAALVLPDAAHGLRVTRAIEAVHTSLLSGKPEPTS